MRRREGSRYGPLNAVEWTHRSTGLKNDSLSQFISEQKILKDFTTFIKAINHRFKIIKLKSSEKDPRRVLVWSRDGLLRKILRSWLSTGRLKPGIHAPRCYVGYQQFWLNCCEIIMSVPGAFVEAMSVIKMNKTNIRRHSTFCFKWDVGCVFSMAIWSEFRVG